MTAAEKRKYVSAKLLEMLAPYGYFSRHGAVWKYSMEGKYVACIAFDLGRAGNLNEVYVEFGSFFKPLKMALYEKKRLDLNGLMLDLYVRNAGCFVRNAGLDFPLLDPRLSFEEQVDSILPFFQRIVYPLLPTSDDLGDYMSKAEQLLQLEMAYSRGIPNGVHIEEIAFAYLSLDRPEEAVRAVSQYAEQCRYAANFIGDHVEIYKYNIESQVHSWNKKCEEALAFKNVIQTDGRKAFESEIARREKESAEFCRQFFHISKG